MSEAGELERAIPLWQAAGRLAAANSAHAEAIVHLRKALALIEELPHDAALLELRIYVALSASVMAAFGHSSEQMLAITGRLEELIQLLPDEPAAFIALWRIANTTVTSRSTEEGRQLSRRVYQAGLQADEYPLIQAGVASQAVAIALGGNATEMPALLPLLRPFDLELERQASLEFNISHSSMALMWAAYSMCSLGFPVRATALLDEAIDRARRVGQQHPLALVLCYGTTVPTVLRQWDALARMADEASDIARENGFPFIANVAAMTQIYIRAQTDEPDLAAIDAALKGAGTTGNRAGLALILCLVAELHRKSGDPDRALALIGAAFAVAGPLGQHYWDAELHRLRGEILAGEKHDAEAGEASFRAALDVARSQGARLLELRAATSYGRLLRDANRAAEAKALLGPVYDWFTEGHDLPDLVDANALLAEFG